MDQKQIEEFADTVITRPGFKKILSGEISRQLEELRKPKKETAISKKSENREKAIKK